MDDFYTVIERDNKEIDLRVNYEYYPAHRATYDSLMGKRNAGPMLTPPEPAEIEILNCFDTLTKSEIELTNQEEESIVEKILEEKENECARILRRADDRRIRQAFG